MPPVLVNSSSTGADGLFSANISMGFTPTVGNKILLSLSYYEDRDIFSVATTNVSWTRIQQQSTFATGIFGTRSEHWIGDVIGPAPGSINIVWFPFNNSIAAAIHEISGLREIWPVDRMANQQGFSSPAFTGMTELPFNPNSYFFGSLAGSSALAGTIPNPPDNGFTTREESIGPSADPLTAHRITSFDKIVSASESAFSSLTYGGVTSWVGMVTTLRGADEPPKPINRVPSTQIRDDITSDETIINLPTPPTTGNSLLMGVAQNAGGNITSVSQDGVVWTRDVQRINGIRRAEIWRGVIGLSPSSTITVTHEAGSVNGSYICEEYSGIDTEDPVDRTNSNAGFGTVMSTGSTGPIQENDELIFSTFYQGSANPSRNGFGYLKTGFEGFSGGPVDSVEVYIQNETFSGASYNVSAQPGSNNDDFVGVIASYRTSAPIPQEGPVVALQQAELNQGGTFSIITDTSWNDFLEIPSGSFIQDHRYLILSSARVGNGNGSVGVRLNVDGTTYDEAQFTPFNIALSSRTEIYSTSRLVTMNSSDSLTMQFIRGGVNNAVVYQANMVAIDFDSINFFQSRDWFHEESTTSIPDMDTVFTNNIGATVSFEPDGTSNYLVIGHAVMSCSDLTPIEYESVFRIQDQTNAVTLAQGGWHKMNASDINTRAYNVMGVLELPPASNIDLAIEMIGGGPGAPGAPGWEHVESSITVIRLEAFFSSGYDADPNLNQVSPGDTMPPTLGSVSAQAQFQYIPDSLNEVVTIAYSEADNVAQEEEGLASQAQFPGLARSLWDTENTTLGNIVSTNEVVVGNYDTNNANTRIPTFGVSLRTTNGLPGIVQWFNGGITGNASVLNRVAIACLGRAVTALPSQTPPPDPVPQPTVTDALQEKPDGVHEEEALNNLLEQFKP